MNREKIIFKKKWIGVLIFLGIAIMSIGCGASSKKYRQIVRTATDYTNPRWSPDGKRILYQQWVGETDQLVIIDKNGSNKKALPITSNRIISSAYWWGNDQIAFTTHLQYASDHPPTDDDSDFLTIFELDKDQEEIVFSDAIDINQTSWHFETNQVALVVGDSGNDNALQIVNLSTGELVTLISPPDDSYIYHIAWDKTGTKIAYIVKNLGFFFRNANTNDDVRD